MKQETVGPVKAMIAADPIVWRDDLRDVLHVCNDTVRRWLKSNRLPKPDINPTRKTMGWRLSTLRSAGFDIGQTAHGSTAPVSASV